jgi:hypothetical protein
MEFDLRSPRDAEPPGPNSLRKKVDLPEERRPPGLKPTMISEGLRGPEGPLFHVCSAEVLGHRDVAAAFVELLS